MALVRGGGGGGRGGNPGARGGLGVRPPHYQGVRTPAPVWRMEDILQKQGCVFLAPWTAFVSAYSPKLMYSIEYCFVEFPDFLPVLVLGW